MQNVFQIEDLPHDEAALEELLSRPTPGAVQTLEKLSGDLIISGVAGKMGVTLAMMARRALDQLGRKDKVIGVAHFSDADTQGKMNHAGVETISLRALAHRFGERLGKEVCITGEEAPTAWLSNAGKAHKAFGYPCIALEQMIEWVAQWVEQGRSTLGKPTHFEEREGKF